MLLIVLKITFVKTRNMFLLPIDQIKVDHHKITELEDKVRAIYRLIIYSRYHLDDDLLDSYLVGMHNLKELVGIKNAQMEAQTEEEAEEYLLNLNLSLDFVVEEINAHNRFDSEVQLFQLLRLISPDAYAMHPNRYRDTLVQIGAHICPDRTEVPGLVRELFYQMKFISNPIIRAIYFHHELIRIHPFADGNGRVTRVAKNWILMYDLYPPTFISDAAEKKEYVHTLGESFKELDRNPFIWNEHTAQFFEHELERLIVNAKHLYDIIFDIGAKRQQELKEKA